MNVFQERGITYLDLHGERHIDVRITVLDFVLQYQDKIPLMIICGNSNQMVNLVTKELKKILSHTRRQGLVLLE